MAINVLLRLVVVPHYSSKGGAIGQGLSIVR